VKYLDTFLEHLFRWTTLSMFVMSMWSITYDTVGYAVYFMLVAIFMHLQSAYYEKKEQVQT